jgi:ubiquinone/menaquinone biosynthesis C-methylase UbiE
LTVVAEKPITDAAPSAEAPLVGEQMRTADANRLLYAELAQSYDSSEHCIAHAQHRRQLEELLDRAIAAGPSSQPRSLDACGGTGNVSELLAGRGIQTTLVDVSPEMLARWRQKAARIGVEAETIEAEIDSFLATDTREWDLIAFSSALHHLDDYAAVAGLAAERLAPGGVLVTAFDPVQTSDALIQRVRRFDYLLSLAASPSALAAAFGRRFRRRREGGENIGDLAERHALHGVDDAGIVRLLTAKGLEIVEHRRYPSTRYAVTERILRATRRSTSFHMIARKPGPQATPTTPTPTTGE